MRVPKAVQLEQAYRAIDLRRRGFSTAEIAQSMQLGKRTAERRIALGYELEPPQNSDRLRQETEHRYDALLKRLNARLESRDISVKEEDLLINTIIKIEHERAWLLGINTPTKIVMEHELKQQRGDFYAA